jgi:hypothetical protein
MNDVLLNYEIYYSQGRQNTTKLERHLPIEEWSLAQLTRAYGLALSVYKRLPNKQIHSINLSRAIQLPVVLECFVGSCTSNYADIVNVLEKNATDIKLEFNAGKME